jgi:hypothetical protein
MSASLRQSELPHGVAAVAAAPAQLPAELPIIHMFWHGAPLSRLERMCMASFAAQGHRVHLHVYENPGATPSGVTLCDARAVLPEKNIFRHSKTGSMAMFADWFRYRVLYEHGGIWSDTDVVCLRPLAFAQPEIYAWEDEQRINNAILGLPARHQLAQWMAECCENPNRFLPYDDGRSKRRKLRRRFLEGNRRGNVKWGEFGPTGFTAAARHLGYADKALPSFHFYPIHYLQWRLAFDAAPEDFNRVIEQSSAVHLWNDMTRREPGFDKNARFHDSSLFERFCERFITSDN